MTLARILAQQRRYLEQLDPDRHYDDPNATVLADVAEEMRRQVEKWGVQHHPDGTMSSFRGIAESAKARNDANHESGSETWTDILCEEYYEAVSEEDPDPLVKELIQVAAVCCSWIVDIRQRDHRVKVK